MTTFSFIGALIAIAGTAFAVVQLVHSRGRRRKQVGDAPAADVEQLGGSSGSEGE